MILVVVVLIRGTSLPTTSCMGDDDAKSVGETVNELVVGNLLCGRKALCGFT